MYCVVKFSVKIFYYVIFTMIKSALCLNQTKKETIWNTFIWKRGFNFYAFFLKRKIKILNWNMNWKLRILFFLHPKQWFLTNVRVTYISFRVIIFVLLLSCINYFIFHLNIFLLLLILFNFYSYHLQRNLCKCINWTISNFEWRRFLRTLTSENFACCSKKLQLQITTENFCDTIIFLSLKRYSEIKKSIYAAN